MKDTRADKTPQPMRLMFLAPNLPPIVCGVADHTRLLADALGRRGHSVMVMGRHGCAGERIGTEPCQRWTGRADDLLQVVEGWRPHWLWVQLSPYGFQRHAVPVGLWRALSRLRRRSPSTGLAVAVHEGHPPVAGPGPLRAILGAVQFRALRAVVRLADRVLPSVDHWRRTCITEYRVEPDRIVLLPVGSNLPRVRLSPAERMAVRTSLGLPATGAVAVAFGLWPTQAMAFEHFGAALSAALRERSLAAVVGLGGERDVRPPWVETLPRQAGFGGRLHILGPQPALQAARVIAACDVGLVPTQWSMWEKSGSGRAFAAAELTLWIRDRGGHRVLERPTPPPDWDGIASAAQAALCGPLRGARR